MQSPRLESSEKSLLSEALSCELAHTIGIVDGLLGLYNTPQDMTIEEVDSLMTDIEKITSRLRQLGRLIVLKCQKDHIKKVDAAVMDDMKKLRREEAQGFIMREITRRQENDIPPPSW